MPTRVISSMIRSWRCARDMLDVRGDGLVDLGADAMHRVE